MSQVVWEETTPFRPVPNGVSYEEWLCCDPSVDWGCSILSCSSSTETFRDPYVNERRWSPRRNHAAATVLVNGNSRILVLGGRALYPEMNISSDWINGGVVGAVPAGYMRQQTLLMNDVWYSENAIDWKVVTPGCFVPHTDYIPSSGKAYMQCPSGLDSECVTGRKLGNHNTVKCVSGRCECHMWTQRERHTATTHNNSVYVMGGITTVTKQKCAELECGGGYRVFLNDVWRSDDFGATWVQLVKHAPWQARSDHSTFSTGSMLYMLAGRGGFDNNTYEYNPIYNDIWTSPDGEVWSLNTSSDETPWGPRSAMKAVYGVDVSFDSRNQPLYTNHILVIGGEVIVPPSPTPAPMSDYDQVAAAAGVDPFGQVWPVDVSVLAQRKALSLAACTTRRKVRSCQHVVLISPQAAPCDPLRAENC